MLRRAFLKTFAALLACVPFRRSGVIPTEYVGPVEINGQTWHHWTYGKRLDDTQEIVMWAFSQQDGLYHYTLRDWTGHMTRVSTKNFLGMNGEWVSVMHFGTDAIVS